MSALCRICAVILYVYGWRRCIIGAVFPLQDYRRDIATDGGVQLTVVSQPIYSAFQVAMVSSDKLQAKESDVLAVLPVGPGITTGQRDVES